MKIQVLLCAASLWLNGPLLNCAVVKRDLSKNESSTGKSEPDLTTDDTSLKIKSPPTSIRKIGLTPLPRPSAHTSIYLNLRLYYDDDLYRKLHKNQSAVDYFLLSMVHSSALSYKNRPLGDLGYKWHFVVQSIQMVPPEEVSISADRDGERYRLQFWEYYRSLVHDLYTSLVLFTGYNFRYNSNMTDTQGLTNTGSGCEQDANRAIIVEAREYRSAYVLAHELGHALGIGHDEDLGCDSSNIMAALVGFGKTKFSDCTARQLKSRLDELFINAGTGFDHTLQCYQYGDYKNPVAVMTPGSGGSNAPYRSVSLDEQCTMALGESFAAVDAQGSDVNSCSKIRCTNVLVDVIIYSALENTTCGPGKYCRAGKCR